MKEKNIGFGSTKIVLILVLMIFIFSTIFILSRNKSDEFSSEEISQEEINEIETITKPIREYEGVNGLSSYRKYIHSVNSRISILIKNSRGEDQKVYENFQKYTTINNAAAIDWYISFDSILQSTRLLDYAILQDQEEIDYQIDILKHYQTQTELFKNNFENRKNLITELNKDIPKDNPTLKYIMIGINEKDAIQRPIFDRYIKTHEYYSRDLSQMVQFLKTNKKKWKYQKGELNFDSPALEKKYDGILDSIGEDEFEISDWATFNFVEIL